MNTKSKVWGLGILVTLSLVAAGAMAAPAERQCDGKQDAGEHAKHAAERFQKADKNNDGFLTQAEVGDERWAHIKVADTNNDAKVSFEEMQQAHKDGKLGHHHGAPKS